MMDNMVFRSQGYFKRKGMEIVDVKDVLLNSEELGKHAQEVAKMHTLSQKTKSTKSLIYRLENNFRVIASVYKKLNKEANKKRELPAASEWLLDNFYKIEEQVKEVKQNLLKEKFLKLYMLENGALKGYPRSYAIAIELIAHTDGRLDEALFIHFIKNYQCQKILSMAEIWSFSLMIKIALVENMRIICQKIDHTLEEWEKAEYLIHHHFDDSFDFIKKNITYKDRVNSSFVEHLLKEIRAKGMDCSDIVLYIEKKLNDYNLSVQQLVEEEHKEQAARKISMGNAIASLHHVAIMNWNHIFESLSLVEEVLRKDPIQTYSLMNFESRDYYRQQVEKIANKGGTSEIRVAREAIACASHPIQEDCDEREKHVGYYLIGNGRKRLFKELGLEHLKDRFQDYSLEFYLWPIVAITAVIILLFTMYAYYTSGVNSFALSLWVAGIVLIPASDIAVAITNWILSHKISPAYLPRLEYKDGIPKEDATMIIVPTLLSNVDKVKELIAKLEVAYLSNREENLFFALVGDYKDAKSKELPEDEKIIHTALDEIAKLNKKYNKKLFYYFHRERRYCEKQDRWLGWERKRGAIVEFNELLSGSSNTSYSVISGDITSLQEIRYVITMDADTSIPIDTAKKLIGIMAHPLNKPVIDEKKGIVVEGYGLVQPRISVDIESANKSFFTRVFAGLGGIDPYTTAISDIYQDLFGEGIFTGKGIYDIAVFRKILTDAIPDHTVLSHDLLEGSYIRTALASDVELIDGYPSKYNSYMMRLHRWVRGDWQLIRWLAATIQNRKYHKVKNPLSSLSKWKIVDNLRRSLVPISLLGLFIFGLLFFPGRTMVWIGLGLCTIGFPIFISFFESIQLQSYKTIGEKLNSNLIYGLKGAIYQAVLRLVFLPYEAYQMGDAIVRTLYRVYVSNKNLLEWVTAADAERKLRNNRQSFLSRMKVSWFISMILLWLVYIFKSNDLIYAVPLAILWLSSPFIAFLVSQEDAKKIDLLTKEEIQQLRRIARKTWAYYEDFADDENHYLPPDNYQEYPPNKLAHRTSPTNIGFLLMAILAARDFGYISTSQLIYRIQKTISAIEKMETWKGHLFNWYDTKTLEVLRPYYISTVDSGNFVTYLITVKEGLLEYIKNPMIDISQVQGLKDTLLLSDGLWGEHLKNIDRIIENREITWMQWKDLLETLQNVAYEKTGWNEKIYNMISAFTIEIDEIFPSRAVTKMLKLLGKKQEQYATLIQYLESMQVSISLEKIEALYEKIIQEADRMLVEEKAKEEDACLLMLKKESLRLKNNVEKMMIQIHDLVDRINRIVDSTQFRPLYDTDRNLFSIGYDIEKEKITNSYYDLLASEARTASYLAISRGEVPKKHWFKLGRTLSVVDGYRGLVSWTGTMFEYFMPSLILKNYANTLMDETYRTVIKAQKKYGGQRDVPWGVSESGYFAFDLLLNYQYKAFGVPDLGLKRGLVEDMVVSPYSTLLALSMDPKGVMKNMHRLIEHGLEGEYGFYEAVDYTPRRLPSGKKKEVVRTFMAHHQGMSLISIHSYLYDHRMSKRFHSDPLMKVGEILLQEKIPLKAIITKEHKEDIKPLERIPIKSEKVTRTYGVPEETIPKCHMLSNGKYSVMITDGGGGYSKMEDFQVTRWREDSITRRYGTYIFIRNLNSDKVWSATYEPINEQPDGYKVNFSQDKAEFIRTDENISTNTEIVVSPEDDIEIRKVTLTNHGGGSILVELTSYLETVMAQQAADIAHPAFSNLFVRTEIIQDYDSILSSRRPREQNQETKWAFHMMNVQGEKVGPLQYETNRANFIGRTRTIADPIALTQPLTNTVGIVLDPIMSLRRKVQLNAGESIKISFITGVAQSREKAIELIKKYQDEASIARAFQLAITRSEVEASYFSLTAEEMKDYQEMISHILYVSPLRRKYAKMMMKNKKGQSGLWAYGISGDLPIVLVSIKNKEDIEIVHKLLKAHEYWKTKGLNVDLVILNEDESNYLQPLQQLLNDIVLGSSGKYLLDQSGGIYIRNANIMPQEDCILFYAVARIILKGEAGPIHQQIKFLDDMDVYPLEKKFHKTDIKYLNKDEPLKLDYFNGYGGFSKDGKEYIIQLKENMHTPAPWINVVSNEKFGFQVSESGAGFVWSQNSRENKLTPWSNDPVSDPSEEVFYIRDEENGEFWSITPLPIREKESYTIHHGLGYSIFKHSSHGLAQELTMFVPTDQSVKINFIKLKNLSNAKRKFTLTYYIKPVMGVHEQITQPFITFEKDEKNEILLIRNTYNSDFPERIAFVGSSEKITSYTCDRLEFTGVHHNLSNPLALKREGLSNRAGAGFDPCAAVQIEIEMNSHEEKELLFLFGQGKDNEEINHIMKTYSHLKNSHFALKAVKDYWTELLETIHVNTPDLSMDLMLNYWLLYQTIACRFWARSAFYQSGGAYGFRDQLQDTLNMLYIFPEATKQQILIHCAHQFVEGDVQHWWHPGVKDKGIRTRFSDDLLWLPFVTAEYIRHTGDYKLLEEEIYFLEEEPLKEYEDERYGIPRKSAEKATVYVHCIRAIEKALKFGRHGIPLMGSGDWNDGMNTVGNKGEGESVWLGWFLYSTLKKFAPICENRKDFERGKDYIQVAEKILYAIEENAWDGSWYIRAFYDDGSPLGSSKNTECMIDSLAQSWSIISGGGREDRVQEAMESVQQYLVKKEEGLIKLFTPPFDQSDQNPGYIKGYVPGVRENGGQYTHAATWVINAFAMMGNGDQAWKLYHLINPINHARTPIECATYKVEPYVIAADVYAVDPHVGRGGWTWYTGAAGWMYRVGLEHILGFKKVGERLLINPCIPKEWREYSIHYKYKNTRYTIIIKNPKGVNQSVHYICIDKQNIKGNEVVLLDDGKDHSIEIILG